MLSLYWSPDSKTIAFSNYGKLEILDVETKEIIKEVDLEQDIVHLMEWMPDGNSILIMNGTGYLYNIYQYSLLEDKLEKLTPTPSLISQIALSPSGDKLVYTLEEENGGRADLYILDLISGDTVRLTNIESIKYGLTWSPDGNSILFHNKGLEKSQFTDLYAIAPTGENLTQITNFAGNERSVEWSNDGKKILFIYNFIEAELEFGKERLGIEGIWVYDFETHEFEYVEGTYGSSSATWRP